MTDETGKAARRRVEQDTRYATTFIKGDGIDIGAGPDPVNKYSQQFPLISSLRAWDVADGDAQHMATVADDTFDFVHSSHCLEHLHNPYEAFGNWIRICKPGGFIITTIPDEDLYEQGGWPSTFNGDHKTSWTILKKQSWSPVSKNVFDLLSYFCDKIEVIKVDLINAAFVYDTHRFDQTYHGNSECAVEFIVRKRPEDEVVRKGRLPKF
jgi:SAM-dependent methyltransferase